MRAADKICLKAIRDNFFVTCGLSLGEEWGIQFFGGE